jgi:hypothetical protein
MNLDRDAALTARHDGIRSGLSRIVSAVELRLTCSLSFVATDLVDWPLVNQVERQYVSPAATPRAGSASEDDELTDFALRVLAIELDAVPISRNIGVGELQPLFTAEGAREAEDRFVARFAWGLLPD